VLKVIKFGFFFELSSKEVLPDALIMRKAAECRKYLRKTKSPGANARASLKT